MGDKMITNMVDYLSKQIELKSQIVMEYQETVVMKDRIIENLGQQLELLKQQHEGK
jgi:hypothetical protein